MNFSGYIVNPKHRSGKATGIRTQWKVSEWEEIRLFAFAKYKGWVCKENHIWAAECIGGKLVELGNTDKDSAYIAKYVVNNNQEWHGYPVTPSRSGDRPPGNVLDAWKNENIITKATQGKIVRGNF